MILCRIPDGGYPQFYDVPDEEISVTRMHDLFSMHKALVPRKPRGWRYESHLGKGVAGVGKDRIEAEDMALNEY